MKTKGTHTTPLHVANAREQKWERLTVRLTREQKALLQRAANLEGRSLSDLVLESAQRHAKDVIKEHTVIQLSVRDTQAFMDALLNPPAPGANLRAAVERYKREVQELET